MGVKLETEGPYPWSSSDTWIGEERACYKVVSAEGQKYRINRVDTRSGVVWKAEPCTLCYEDIDLSKREDLACDPSV